MADAAALFADALRRHRAGELDEAAALYRQVLEAQPDHPDAMYLSGTLLLQQGRFAESIERLERVAALWPDVPDAHNNLGVAHKALGQWEQAARAFQAALQANPEYAQAAFNLGMLMQDRGLFADAEKCFRRAVELQPDDVACRLQLGQALSAQQKWSDAEDCLRSAAAHRPDNLDLQVNLAFVLARQERLDEAADIYRRIVGVCPDYHQVHNNLSYIDERRGKLDAAVAAARRAVEIEPRYADGYNNLGIALRSLHKLDEACESFLRAVELAGDFPLAEFNLGTTLLLQGNYAGGWAGYARYRDTLETPPPRLPGPEWDGRPLPGKTLLVTSDQGFGDTLQFARFLPDVKHRSQAELVLQCPPELTPLLTGLEGTDQVVSDGQPLPGFDAHVPLSLLPGLLQVELATLPAKVPYIPVNPAIRAELEELLAGAETPAFKVGLVWQGNPQQARDVVRSCSLERFRPLADVPGISWFSLQTGEGVMPQLQAVGDRFPLIDVGTHLRDFADTAAVLERLDLLITVDTAAAHLAGAMGRPVWTLLCHTPDWRWLLDRDDSPWYPTMRLFRQPSWGDWNAVVDRVAEELRRLVST